MKVVVAVNDKYLWCLPPFAYLFNKYWGEDQDVVVAGYNYPGFSLPHNFTYFSISNHNYPKERWVEGMMEFLKVFRNDNSHFVLMLEDYWLTRTVDRDGILTLQEYAREYPDILRVDLTSDRLYAGGSKDMDYCGHFDIVYAKGSQYEMSLQAGIWNTEAFIDILGQLPPDKHSAWSVELEGTTIVNNSSYRVVGTRQIPVRYLNAYNSSTGFNQELKGMVDEDKYMVRSMLPMWANK